MQQITLRVEDPAGQTKVSVPAKIAERADELLGEMTHGEVVLHRDAWRDVDDVLDRRNDRVAVDDLRDGSTFLAGRFDYDERGDGMVTVAIEGYELDAKDAEPTADNVVYQNYDDSQIVTDLLTQVPTLEPGTIETIATNLSMSFSHAEPSKALRDVCPPTGGELRYNDDRTVDYVDRIGSDKPEIVLSPDEQTVIEDPEITEDARENVTHIRGFGALSGPDQITAEAVANSYDGGRPIWREYENKDVKEESRLQRIIDQQVEEYDGEPRHIEIDVTTVGLDIELGDRVTVELPEENIDRMLRVIKRRELLTGVGATLSLVLSNRLLTGGEDSQEARKDLQRFNRGYQGFVDRSQITSGWNPAGDGTPQELVVVNWPDDIVEEKDVTLAVQGRSWRSPVDFSEHFHEVVLETDDHDHLVDVLTTSGASASDSDNIDPIAQGTSGVDGSFSFSDDFTVPSLDGDTRTCILFIDFSISTADADLTAFAGGVEIDISSGFDTIYSESAQTSLLNSVPKTWMVVYTGDDIQGDTVDIEFEGSTNYEANIRYDISSVALGDHDHLIDILEDTADGGGQTLFETTDPENAAIPEIITEFDGSQYYPSDVTIEVNGTEVETIAGDDSSDWTETIDLEGELNPGLNTISATPGTRGELNLSLASELFRRGRSE